MFDFIDRYIADFKPHVARAGLEASAYAERCIALLERIVENTEINDPDLLERTFQYNNLPAGTTQNIADIPPNEVWKLRYFFVDGTGAGGAPQVYLLLDGRVIWNNSLGTMFPADLRLRGGHNLSILITTQAAPNLFLNFEVEQPRAKRTGIFGGQPEYKPDHNSLDPDPRQEGQLTSRHASPGIFAGVNAIGDRAEAYREG